MRAVEEREKRSEFAEQQKKRIEDEQWTVNGVKEDVEVVYEPGFFVGGLAWRKARRKFVGGEEVPWDWKGETNDKKEKRKTYQQNKKNSRWTSKPKVIKKKKHEGLSFLRGAKQTSRDHNQRESDDESVLLD